MRYVVGTALAGASGYRVVDIGKGDGFLPDRVAGRCQAGRRHRHNEIHILVVVVLKQGRDVGDLALRVRSPNLQILALLESQLAQAIEDTLYADVGAGLWCEVDKS